jgi:anti-sigma B factor antagonist
MPHSSSPLEADLEPFRVDVHPERDSVRVVPVGEVDIATVGEVDARLRELNQAGFRHLVLDLREVTFIDSSGMRLVLTCHATARQNGVDFTVLEGPPAVQRIFEVAGLLDFLPFRT